MVHADVVAALNKSAQTHAHARTLLPSLHYHNVRKCVGTPGWRK